MNETRRVVFVCTGNVCRSAMAEHLLRHLAAKHGLPLEAASAGIAARPHFRVPEAVRRMLSAEGVPPFEHKPQLAAGALLRSADLILAMAAEHRDYIVQLYPDLAPRTRLFREAAGFGRLDVEDPMAEPDEAFARCLSAIRDSLEAMIRARFHDPRGSPAPKNLAERLTSLQRPLLAAVLPARRMRAAVIARLVGSETVLDVGCGTGGLAIAIKRALPSCRLVGVDADPRMIRLARRRAEKLGLTFELRSTDAAELPFGGPAFDVAVAVLLLGGLRPEKRRAALRETARVLRPGGRLLVLDVAAARFAPELAEAGFSAAREVWTRTTLLGVVRLLESGRGLT